jgi:hypothetical protein
MTMLARAAAAFLVVSVLCVRAEAQIATWDPVNVSVHWVLSNGNETAGMNATVNASGKSTTSKSAGLLYAEFHT